MANSASSNELHSITKHNNIVISGVGSNEVLKFDGSNWINQTLAESGIAPVASPTFTTGATSPAWITGNDGTVKFNDNDGSHYFTLAANATTTTSVAYTWPVNAGTDNYVLTTNGSGVLTWEEVVGGTSVAGTTDNGILTFVNSGSTFAAESTLTYTGTVLTVNAGGGTPQIQAITTATSGRAVAFQAKIAASSTDNSAGLDFIEGSGNGNAGNMAYHLIYEGKSSGSNLRLNSEDIDGSSTGGTIFQVLDGTKELLVGENNSMPSVTKGIAKAWSKTLAWPGSGSNFSIQGSYNVVSIADNGTGLFTHTWDIDFENANTYVNGGWGSEGRVVGVIYETAAVGSSQSTVVIASSGDRTDCNPVMFVAFGEVT